MCVYGKHHQTPFPLSEDFHAKEIFRIVQTNLYGPMATSHGWPKYVLTFIDDFSRKTFFNTMKITFGVLTNLKFS